MNNPFAMIAITVATVDEVNDTVEFTAKGSDKVHAIQWAKSGDVGEMDAGTNSVVVAPYPKKDTTFDILLSKSYVELETKAGRDITVGPEGFKYPERLADMAVAYTNVPFRITKLVVSGVELVTGEHFGATLDLTDPRLAALAQSINYDAGSQDVSLALSQAALEELGISR